MFAGQRILIRSGNEDHRKKRVAVIGCGVGGLVSAKVAMDYGHQVTAYERQSDIGGLWNWKTFGTDEGHAEIADPDIHCYPAYKSLYTNTCKYNTTFSDFPPLDSQKSEFMTHEEVYEYAKAYAGHFQLNPQIKLNAHVSRLDKEAKEWHVTYKTGSDVKVDVFDYVIVATGAFAYPHDAEVDGKENFKGVLIHSGQVRNERVLFKGKRVFIVGGAYSAAEMINLSLTSGATKVYVSPTRRPGTQSAWTVDRLVKSIYGDMRPWDYLMTRECSGIVNNDYTPMLGKWCYPFHKAKADSTLTYPGDAIAITNVQLVEQAKSSGVLEFVDPVERYGEHDVILRGGMRIPDIDVIVCATGMQYRIQGPHAWPRAADECIAMARRFLGNHFDDYVDKVKQNIYPRSGVLDPAKGPYNVYI